ncbi:MAG: cysteine peptidase family C39 domain-containing protein [Kiritimatiellia bacterium]|nr:cysteine peptidase family C39 domain-containing protein [Kiritimatiellia bacterium]
MRSILIFISLWAFTSGAMAEPIAFDRHVNDSAELWTLAHAYWLQGETAGWFRPVSDAPDADLRYPGYSNSPQSAFLGFRAYEIILKFNAESLAGITISPYNRGDAGELSKTDFATLVAAIDKAVASWSGRKGALKPSRKLKSHMQIDSKTWVLTNTLVEMKWGTSKYAVLDQVSDRSAPGEKIKGFRAEYIQVILTPRAQQPKASNPAGSSPAGDASARGIRKNVKKDNNGFVYIDNIPMVDQGQRGYCAVATAERLLKYYGKDIDQHTLAQLADTRTGGGTSAEAMFDMLRKMGLKFRVKAKTHVDFNANIFLRFVEKYNFQAKKEKKGAINPIQNNIINVEKNYEAMDPGLLRRTRCEREPTGFKNFLADIEKCVDQGIPLAWSVALGIVPETPQLPQTKGGHMRIIFGYNKATKEILYSDSWGAGHERKVMGAEDAWTITHGLYSLDPRY